MIPPPPPQFDCSGARADLCICIFEAKPESRVASGKLENCRAICKSQRRTERSKISTSLHLAERVRRGAHASKHAIRLREKGRRAQTRVCPTMASILSTVVKQESREEGVALQLTPPPAMNFDLILPPYAPRGTA